MSEVNEKYLKDKNGDYFSPIYSLCSIKIPNDKLKIKYDEGKIKFTFTNPRDKSMIYFTDKGEVVCNTLIEDTDNTKDEEMIAAHLAEQAWLDSGLSLDGTYSYVIYVSLHNYEVEIRNSSTTTLLTTYEVNTETGVVIEVE